MSGYSPRTSTISWTGVSLAAVAFVHAAAIEARSFALSLPTPKGGRPCISQITATRRKSTARARRAWVSLEHAALQKATGWLGVGNAIVPHIIELGNKHAEATTGSCLTRIRPVAKSVRSASAHMFNR